MSKLKMHKTLLTLTFSCLCLIATSVCSSCLFAEDGEKSPQTTTETPNDLPKVLIIGDSISLGYTPFVRRAMEKEAVVTHNPGNAQHTATGLKKIDDWLKDKEYDVIHFNWGLWDLCYRHPDSKTQGNRDKENGKVTFTLEEYEANLTKLVKRLKETNAKLIWANTTVVPENEAGRIVGDDDKYNAVAMKIMKANDIAINDLNALTKTFPPELFTAPGNVHYKAVGSQKIAEQVIASIQKALAE